MKLLTPLVLAACLAAHAQTPLLQIKIAEGEGGVHAAGARAGSALAVDVADELGRPVEGAAVSFQMPEDGPGGVFATGLRSEIVLSDARGRARVRNFRLNDIAGPFDIRVTASKASARAGLLSRQYIAGTEQIQAARPARPSRKKWYVAAAMLAAGAAAGGVAFSGNNPVHTSPAPPSPPAFAIGAPSISVGRP